MKEKSSINFWFVGTGDFAALLLPMLAIDFNFSRVITRALSKAKRGLKEEITPVERAAVETGFKPLRTHCFAHDTLIKNEFLENESKPDGVFVIDFGEKINEPFLTGTKFGCLNIHPSILPKYRGAAPIQRALENGESTIGVTFFRLVKEMDAGPVISQAITEISIKADYPEIMRKTAVLGSGLASEWLSKIITDSNQVSIYPQDQEAATYAPKILKSESYQSFNIAANLLHNRVRAFYPNPGVWVAFRGKRLKLITTCPFEESPTSSVIGAIIGFHDGAPIVKCKERTLILERVQPEGKRVMDGVEWVNGLRIKPGDIIE